MSMGGTLETNAGASLVSANPANHAF